MRDLARIYLGLVTVAMGAFVLWILVTMIGWQEFLIMVAVLLFLFSIVRAIELAE